MKDQGGLGPAPATKKLPPLLPGGTPGAPGSGSAGQLHQTGHPKLPPLTEGIRYDPDSGRTFPVSPRQIFNKSLPFLFKTFDLGDYSIFVGGRL
jgi:hypothetical protein